MTEKETGMLMVLISDIWNNFNFLPEDTGKIRLWHKLMGDIDFDTAQGAIYSLANTNIFAPSPAEIRKAAVNMTTIGGITSPQEIWRSVYNLVQRYGFTRYQNAVEHMDEITKRTVRVVGWRNICYDPIDKVERKFLEVYRELAENSIHWPSDMTLIEGGL